MQTTLTGHSRLFLYVYPITYKNVSMLVKKEEAMNTGKRRLDIREAGEMRGRAHMIILIFQ